ncbi:unnamed protein product [Timema podura]|uniref:Uncharacterized protein n=1 Tax=Timema podura TaxID=61482 RepID=A0ABN7PK70_TIMPD|nr:unnamed protein product [Timema podura]
MAWTDIFASNT